MTLQQLIIVLPWRSHCSEFYWQFIWNKWRLPWFNYEVDFHEEYGVTFVSCWAGIGTFQCHWVAAI